MEGACGMSDRLSPASSSAAAGAWMKKSTLDALGAQEQLKALRALPLWADLPPQDLATIATQSKVLRFAKNQEVFCPEGPASGSCFLVEGSAKLLMESSDGRKKVVEIVGPGYSFNECFALPSRQPSMRVVALGAVRVLWVPAATLQQEIQAHPSLAMHLMRALTQRMGELLQDLDSQSFDTAMQRFVRYIVARLLPAGAGTGREPVAVTLPAGKAVVASRLSLSPEYFSRMLRQLETEHLIAVDNRTIVIHDPARLVATYGPHRL